MTVCSISLPSLLGFHEIQLIIISLVFPFFGLSCPRHHRQCRFHLLLIYHPTHLNDPGRFKFHFLDLDLNYYQFFVDHCVRFTTCLTCRHYFIHFLTTAHPIILAFVTLHRVKDI